MPSFDAGPAPSASLFDDLGEMVLAAVSREYPNHLTHLLAGPEDALAPRALHPSFHGSFDWHSAVHGHWSLARLLRAGISSRLALAARETLDAHLAAEPLAAEASYLEREARAGFERPYGLAWLLQLAAELREWGSEARAWHEPLRPLEEIASRRLLDYAGSLPWPVRSGEHSQTAFALGLALDWARAAGDAGYAAALGGHVERLFGPDVDAPIAFEPGGHDFLSPVLAEADLMRRVLPRHPCSRWLDAFLPELAGSAAERWLTPVESPNREDGKLAHLDGLNASRAWMLEGIAASLGERDPRRAVLSRAAERHRQAALARAVTDVYAGSHWLGTFAVYLTTRRGLPPAETA